MQLVTTCLERHSSERKRCFVVVEMNNAKRFTLGAGAYLSSSPMRENETAYLDGVDNANTRAPSTGWCLGVTKLFKWKLKNRLIHCFLL